LLAQIGLHFFQLPWGSLAFWSLSAHAGSGVLFLSQCAVRAATLLRLNEWIQAL
jgi:hypothetical protein